MLLLPLLLLLHADFLHSKGLRQPLSLKRLPTPTEKGIEQRKQLLKAQQVREQQIQRQREQWQLPQQQQQQQSAGGSVVQHSMPTGLCTMPHQGDMQMALQPQQQQQRLQRSEKDQGSSVSTTARSSSEAGAPAAAAPPAPAAVVPAADSCRVDPAADSCRVSPSSNRSSCSPRSAASTPRSRLRSSSNSPRRSLAGPAMSPPEQQQHQRQQQQQRHVLPQLDLDELQRQQQQLQDLQQLKSSCHPHAGLDSDDWQLLRALLTGGRQAASTAAAAACTAPLTTSGSGWHSARKLRGQLEAGSSCVWSTVPGSSGSTCRCGERLCHSSREGPVSTRSVTAGGGGCRTCRCTPGRGSHGPSGTCRAPHGALATSLPGNVTLKQAAVAACGSRLSSRGGCSYCPASAAGAAERDSAQRAGVSAVHDNTQAAAAAGRGLDTQLTLETLDGEQQQQPLLQEEEQPLQLQAQIGVLQTDDPFDWDSIDLVDTSTAAPARATLTCLAAATATGLPAGGLQAAEAQAAALLASMAGDAESTSSPAAFRSLQQLTNFTHVGSSTCCCQLPAAATGCAAFGSVQLLDTSLLQPVPCHISYNLNSTARKHRQHKEGTSSSGNGSSSCRGGMCCGPQCGKA